ncbi:putative amino-acid ABC transporter-binding protein precursor [Gimesia maris]|uniref:substrate-binding periplasmic protein n=1 Tax=Gimesia maris TaxID=122 RepID=UPI0011896048|nr:ABC transporter substrate-binding protein [Gimesia maris]QDT78245.1 putative amino-acid ABC transporter-binding protein precursor [Gimesia maris]
MNTSQTNNTGGLRPRDGIQLILIIAVISAIAVLIFRGNGNGGSVRSGTAAARDTLDKVITRGKLRAGYFVQPPAVMKDPNTGEVTGTFVEAIRAIGEELGVEVEFIEVDLAKFTAGLQNDLYDVSVGPTFRTIKRARVVAFTETIFYLGYTGITKKGRAGEFATEQDIDRKGVKVAVKEGSAIHTYVRDNFKNAEIIVLSGTDLTLPLQAVSSGQADVGLMNEHTVEYYLRSHDKTELILDNNPIQVLGMAWAVNPDDYRWLQFLNTSLEALISTGQMASWEREIYGEKLRRNIIEPAAPSVRTDN